jgi:Ca2+ transporting ATPase
LNRTGKVIPFTPVLKEKIISYIRENLSIKEALRCIGMAYAKRVINPNDLKESSKFEIIESNLVFCGVAGLIDPPRAEVKPAIKLCRDAGIRVIIITGDNKNTAEAIGKRIGLFDDVDINSDSPNALTEMGLSFTGKEFDNMSDVEKEEAVKTARLFARVEPAHKLTIVRLLQKQGHVVGMTGDGVNDSPALKQSDIGIAMGSGTSVAKSAGKMILQDDSFATIAVAVQEGRTIYANTKQFIRYLISSNIGEVVSIFLASILGLPEHLNTIQLLFCNLVTDGLPANAIGYNKADPTLMKQPPRKKDEPIITSWQLIRFLITGTYVGISTVLGFIWWFLYASAGPKISFYELTHFHSCKGTECDVFMDPRASTISLSILVVIEMLVALSAVSENQSMFKVTPLNNLYLIGAVSLSMIIHIVIVYAKPLQVIFGVTAIGYEEWMAILGFSLPILVIEEILKFFGRNIHH